MPNPYGDASGGGWGDPEDFNNEEFDGTPRPIRRHTNPRLGSSDTHGDRNTCLFLRYCTSYNSTSRWDAYAAANAGGTVCHCPSALVASAIRLVGAVRR